MAMLRQALTLGLATGFAITLAASQVSAATRTVGYAKRTARTFTQTSRRPNQVAGGTGYRDLYTDGLGSSFGFHPGPYRGPLPNPVLIRRARQAYAIRETMAIDQLTRGYGYGSPFYAGFYGPGSGRETGFGRAY